MEAALGGCLLLSASGHLWSINNVAATFQPAHGDVHKPQVHTHTLGCMRSYIVSSVSLGWVQPGGF